MKAGDEGRFPSELEIVVRNARLYSVRVNQASGTYRHGTVILDEAVPRGVFGVLRVLAFAAVTAGAVLLARPEKAAPGGRPVARELASAGQS